MDKKKINIYSLVMYVTQTAVEDILLYCKKEARSDGLQEGE